VLLRLRSRDTLFRDELKLGSRVTLSSNLTVYAKILQNRGCFDHRVDAITSVFCFLYTEVPSLWSSDSLAKLAGTKPEDFTSLFNL
jgi:hypothetical protein